MSRSDVCLPHIQGIPYRPQPWTSATRLARFDPTGRLLCVILTPPSRPSSSSYDLLIDDTIWIGRPIDWSKVWSYRLPSLVRITSLEWSPSGDALLFTYQKHGSSSPIGVNSTASFVAIYRLKDDKLFVHNFYPTFDPILMQITEHPLNLPGFSFSYLDTKNALPPLGLTSLHLNSKGSFGIRTNANVLHTNVSNLFPIDFHVYQCIYEPYRHYFHIFGTSPINNISDQNSSTSLWELQLYTISLPSFDLLSKTYTLFNARDQVQSSLTALDQIVSEIRMMVKRFTGWFNDLFQGYLNLCNDEAIALLDDKNPTVYRSGRQIATEQLLYALSVGILSDQLNQFVKQTLTSMEINQWAEKIRMLDKELTHLTTFRLPELIQALSIHLMQWNMVGRQCSSSIWDQVVPLREPDQDYDLPSTIQIPQCTLRDIQECIVERSQYAAMALKQCVHQCTPFINWLHVLSTATITSTTTTTNDIMDSTIAHDEITKFIYTFIRDDIFPGIDLVDGYDPNEVRSTCSSSTNLIWSIPYSLKSTLLITSQCTKTALESLSLTDLVALIRRSWVQLDQAATLQFQEETLKCINIKAQVSLIVIPHCEESPPLINSALTSQDNHIYLGAMLPHEENRLVIVDLIRDPEQNQIWFAEPKITHVSTNLLYGPTLESDVIPFINILHDPMLPSLLISDQIKFCCIPLNQLVWQIPPNLNEPLWGPRQWNSMEENKKTTLPNSMILWSRVMNQCGAPARSCQWLHGTVSNSVIKVDGALICVSFDATQYHNIDPPILR